MIKKLLKQIRVKLFHNSVNLLRRYRFPEKYKTLGFLCDYINHDDFYLTEEAIALKNRIITHICTPQSWDFPKNCICLCYDEEEADDAMKRHAAVVISDIQYKKYPTIVAKDPLAVYAKLCRYYRDLQKNIPITAVIGSIGKTTTKNMIGTVYSSMWQTYYTKANDNTHTTMGFAVQHIPPFAEKMIQEVHEGEPNQTQHLSQMLNPDVVVITAIDKSHIEKFHDSDEIIKEICSITKHMKEDGVVIINIDEFTYFDLLNGKRTITISANSKEADFHAEDIQVLESGLRFRIIVKESNESYNITLHNIFAKHNVICALYAFAAGYYNHAEPATIAKSLSSYKTLEIRQNIIKTNDNVLIYADCYNAIVRSIKSAIDACEIIPVTGKRIAILGDIEEGGEFSDNMHKDVIKYVQDSQFDILLTLGDRMKKAISGNLFRDSLYVQSFTSIADLSNKLKEIANSGDLVLLKASRASQLEKCIKIVWPQIYSDLSKAHKKNETGFNRRYLYY